MTKGITQTSLHKAGELTRQYWAQDTDNIGLKTQTILCTIHRTKTNKTNTQHHTRPGARMAQ